MQMRLTRSFSTAPRPHIEWHRFTPRAVIPQAHPLLLIHGFACGLNDWGAVPRIIATRSKREVLSFDNRGIGQSGTPPGPYSVAAMASDALHVLDAAGVERAHVMGISLGGMIAQELALRDPSRVQSLILGCTSHGGADAQPPAAHFVSLSEAWASEAAPNESDRVDEFMRLMLPAVALEAPAGRTLLTKFKASFLETARSSAGLHAQLAAVAPFDSAPRLGGIACPALVIAGNEDAVVSPANARSLAARLPRARLRLWEGAGHFWWATRPLEAAELLSSFLTECDGSPD